MPGIRPIRIVFMAAALLVVALTPVFAQTSAQPSSQPLTPPIYLLEALRPLRVGDEVAGSLQRGDGQNFKDGSYLDLYLVRGVSGERLTLELDSNAFDAMMLLFDAFGNLVASDDDSGGNSNALLEYTLPAAGNYLVVATSWSASEGSYTLRRLDPAAILAQAQPIRVGESIEGTLAGSAVRYRLVLEGPGALEMIVRSEAFDTTLRLLDADGEEIAFDDDGFGEGTDSMLFQRLGAGTYYLVVDGFGFAEGPFELSTELFKPEN